MKLERSNVDNETEYPSFEEHTVKRREAMKMVIGGLAAAATVGCKPDPKKAPNLPGDMVAPRLGGEAQVPAPPKNPPALRGDVATPEPPAPQGGVAPPRLPGTPPVAPKGAAPAPKPPGKQPAAVKGRMVPPKPPEKK